MLAGMDWQQLISLAIVAAAAGLLSWSRFHRRQFSFHTHCGCSAAGSTPPQGSIVFHARKGERPSVLVKMN
jgi:hypothetical protein